MGYRDKTSKAAPKCNRVGLKQRTCLPCAPSDLLMGAQATWRRKLSDVNEEEVSVKRGGKNAAWEREPDIEWDLGKKRKIVFRNYGGGCLKLVEDFKLNFSLASYFTGVL